MSAVDVSALDALQYAINDADDQLRAADIDGRYSAMEASAAELEALVTSFSGQLAAIQLDVDNIRLINDTLPRDCFNKFDLEPVEPQQPSVY